MRILLAAINAKYIHSNLAVYSLKSYAGSRLPDVDIQICEYTINQQIDRILADLYEKKPDMLCFSCYIWNITCVREVLAEVKKVLPEVKIWLGGPEVSYNAVAFLKKYPQADGIMKGEGEQTFLELLQALRENTSLTEILGITWRREDGEIENHPWRPAISLDEVPFVYQDMELFSHRIIYYESSRGCPFSCSYCLSSIDKCLRFRSLEKVLPELQFFLDQKVPQVKFVDRTFNVNHEHTMAVWRYLTEHDNGITNFHFEISADLLREEEIDLIAKMRPGLIQLEIGVQSTNPNTIREIGRTMNFPKVASAVARVKACQNTHQHLDLIAGLPFEDYESFRKSFDDVYALHPEQLQLGFLKVLKGSRMYEQAQQYGVVWQERPPFEVLKTNWLSYGEVLALKRVEEMVEVYYNSGQFACTLPKLEKRFQSPFRMFEALADYYRGRHLLEVNHARAARYEILLSFVREIAPEEEDLYRELMTFDFYLRENAKSRPEFCGEPSVRKEEAAVFYDREAQERIYLEDYEGYDKKQLRKMTHLERKEGTVYLFDYRHRNPYTGQARIQEVTI